MKRYIIEREMPGIGLAQREQFREAAQKSNEALAQLAPDVQWVESYVTDDKVYCVYLAKDESLVRKHADMSGFPADKITEVKRIMDPTVAAA
ncbi:MAG: DUF4242 domain-containing protein [Variibacter sp.]|nr:DUF4242 domain-containing protein [Variibacter sp.]